MMTTRDFLNAVISASVSDEVTEKATALIASLDNRNEKRKTSPKAVKSAEDVVARREQVFANLGFDTLQTAEQIAEMTGFTVGQVRSALSVLVRDGKVTKDTVKVDKSKRVAYVRAKESV